MSSILNPIPERPASSPYSARNNTKPVHFFYENRVAKSVTLIGDFNDWHPTMHRMQRRPDGWWFIELPLTHGHHHYLFLVDGVPTLDPNAGGTAQLEPWSRVSVLAVS